MNLAFMSMDNEEDNRANEGRVDGGEWAGLSLGLEMAREGVLRVGTQVGGVLAGEGLAHELEVAASGGWGRDGGAVG
ncbi:hypothetical protein CYMTET_34132 [Cymbomonas tetramitiformis]|uniref:Uncharacterized protein n=1 Tax=Cymbomonas tetramitiformis TaxID=36881 RepID=A0AAE0FBQ3_9CHLO|nr:hypothetical protein CYMTET_34132 [Cymbomonas tetramitiformis]